MFGRLSEWQERQDWCTISVYPSYERGGNMGTCQAMRGEKGNAGHEEWATKESECKELWAIMVSRSSERWWREVMVVEGLGWTDGRTKPNDLLWRKNKNRARYLGDTCRRRDDDVMLTRFFFPFVTGVRNFAGRNPRAGVKESS